MEHIVGTYKNTTSEIESEIRNIETVTKDQFMEVSEKIDQHHDQVNKRIDHCDARIRRDLYECTDKILVQNELARKDSKELDKRHWQRHILEMKLIKNISSEVDKIYKSVVINRVFCGIIIALMIVISLLWVRYVNLARNYSILANTYSELAISYRDITMELNDINHKLNAEETQAVQEIVE